MGDVEKSEAVGEPEQGARAPHSDESDGAADDDGSSEVRVAMLDLEPPRAQVAKRRESGVNLKKRVIVSVLAIALAIAFFVVIALTVTDDNGSVEGGDETDQAAGAGPGRYPRAAVAADVGLCSEMGRDILKQGGTAVDAAITTLLCVGVVNPQSSGIGGGMFMLIYHRDTGKTEALMAREKAPADATANMTLETFGSTSIAVPGELNGMWEAHQRYGSLPWTALFEPVIRLAEDGFPVTVHLARALGFLNRRIFNFTLPQFAGYRERYGNEDGSWKEAGDIIYAPKLARTLRAIAKNGLSELTNGTTAQELVREIQEYGGIITLADLAEYTVDWREAEAHPIGRGMRLLTTPSPSGGPILRFIINILRKYGMSSADFKTTQATIQSYHRFVEASKFAFGLRSYLGDVDTPEVREVLSKTQSEAFAESVYSQIRQDAVTFTNATGYNALLNTAALNGGTCHLSVVDQFGNAVSATSTVNSYFGSQIMSNKTGLILNNEMADFDTPTSQPASDANHIAPGKMPLSAMSPVIVVNQDGAVELVTGSAGSRAIITTNAWITLRSVLTDASLKEIIDEKRVHNQLQPKNVVYYEAGFSTDVLDGLVSMGHVVQNRTLVSISQSIRRVDDGWMAYSDPRKQGYAAGY